MRIFIFVLTAIMFPFSAWAQGENASLVGIKRLIVTSDVSVYVGSNGDLAMRPVVTAGALEDFVIDLRGDALHLSRNASSASASDEVIVWLRLPSLEYVEASSGGHIVLSDVQSAEVSVRSLTGGFIEARGVEVGTISIFSSTGGDVKIDGTCARLTARADQGGLIHADHLRCGIVKAEATNGALLRAFAIDQADLVAKRGATLVLSGTAEVTSQVKESWAVMRVWAKPMEEAG